MATYLLHVHDIYIPVGYILGSRAEQNGLQMIYPRTRSWQSPRQLSKCKLSKYINIVLTMLLFACDPVRTSATHAVRRKNCNTPWVKYY